MNRTPFTTVLLWWSVAYVAMTAAAYAGVFWIMPLFARLIY